MELLSINAEQKHTGIVSAIGLNPSSWQGWYAVQIDIMPPNNDHQMDGHLVWVQSVLESYLKDADGRAYFCYGRALHLICKNIPEVFLAQAASHICDLLQSEEGLLSEYAIYNLQSDGFAYVSRVFEEQGDVFSIPVSKYSEIAQQMQYKLDEFEGDIHDKKILNHKDFIKALLVEDDPVTRWMVRNTLKHECTLMTAPTAHQAFAKFQAFQPDVVFLDIDLPDKNGREVLSWIMHNDPGVTVVMFSSNSSLDNISQSIEEGASGFIAKPFLKESLLHYIRNHNR